MKLSRKPQGSDSDKFLSGGKLVLPEGRGVVETPLPLVLDDTPLSAQKPGAIVDVIGLSPVVRVKVDDLVTYQAPIDLPRLKPWDAEKAPPIQVVKYKDRLFIFQGNHRAVSAWVAGAETVEAHVLDLDTAPNQKLLKPRFRREGLPKASPLVGGTANDTAPNQKLLKPRFRREGLPKASPLVGGTANEVYRDAALRHQIDLRRYTAGVTKQVARLLEEADRDLTERLRTRLARFEGRDLDFTGERWKALLTDIRGARAAALAEYKTLVRDELGQLAVLEGQAEIDLLQSSITIEVGFMAVNADQLRAIVTSSPFQGRFLRDWFSTLEAVDQQRLTTALQLGMTNGEPIDDIVRRVVGTRKNAYADGILSMTRRDAQGIVRTAVNHVSNTARGYVWDANSDIITAKVWVSTLDGRTTAVCRARDGHGSPVGDNELPADIPLLQPKDAKPPAHFNCRSVMVAYIDGVGLLGNRPTVTDIRTRAKREIDFRRMAKEQGKPIQDIRKAWAAENVGRVPSATTYQDFLKRQPASFQDEVLGKTKAKLFREGGLNVDQFVDRAGNELTLSQLAERKPDAFRKAGLDPEKF